MFNFFAITLKAPSQVMQVASQIGEPGFVGNLLVILVFLVVICIYVFLLDRHNMMINLFSLYIAFLIINFFPYKTWQLGGWLESWWGQLIFLAAMIFVVAVILSLTHLFRVVYTSNFLARWWQAIISAILFSGFLTAVVLSILPKEFLGQFSPSFLNLFVSDVASFLWLILPLVGLLLIRFGRRGPGRPAY